MKIKKIAMGTLIIAGVGTPLGFAFARKVDNDIDLTKNIIVISEEKNENGIRSYPMDAFWNSVIKDYKRDFPEGASKYNIIVKHGDQSSFEELSTLGVTAQSMPDLWFFASNRLPYLYKNGAINPISINDKTRMLAKSSGIPVNRGSFETYQGKDFAIRFKMETVFFFMNKEKLKNIYHNKAQLMVNGIMIPSKTAASGNSVLTFSDGDLEITSTITVDELFENIKANSIHPPSSPVSFEVAHKNVASFFSAHLDLTRVSNEMKTTSIDKKHLLPFNGANKWWANSFIYATGKPEQNGLIWEENGNPTSQIMKLDDNTPSRDVMRTYFNLSTSGPKDIMANDGTKKAFMNGLSAFTISGTWDNDRFISAFKETWKDKLVSDPKFIENNLFAIGLPQVTDSNGVAHQMKHYIQGKSLGVNSRNEPGKPKYNEIQNIISEMFTQKSQQAYASSVEAFVPANYTGGFANANKSYINSVLDLIKEDPNASTVNLSSISNLYEDLDFGRLWEDITHPLAADLSGEIGINDYDRWVNDSIKMLKDNGFKEPK